MTPVPFRIHYTVPEGQPPTVSKDEFPFEIGLELRKLYSIFHLPPPVYSLQ